VLTPLAVDPSHPFPVLLNKSLNLAVLLLDPRQPRKTHRIAVVQVPRVLPRITRLPDQDGKRVYVFTADIVQEHLAELFPGLEVLHSCSFRVTRDSNIDVDDMQATDLMSSIERELIKRRRGEPGAARDRPGRAPRHRRSLHPRVPARRRRRLLLQRHGQPRPPDGAVPDHRDPRPARPAVQPRKLFVWTSPDDMFADLRDGDVLLHHPYESFSTVEDFVRLAARDPRVLAIKQTIYRAGSKSPTMDALIEAAQQRKQVTVGRRAEGALRRGGQHPVGAAHGAGRCPRRLRHRRHEDARQGDDGGPPRGRRHQALLPRRHRQLQPDDRAALYRRRPADRARRRRRGRSPRPST
jgi:polyphosphate kinase